MADIPVVSVVVIFLNADKFLREAIDSILSQTYTDWELFLVDDGSTDRSTEIAKSYVRQHPEKIFYLEHYGHVNKGMSASRNLGIEQARGEFVGFLDADDIWFPDKLRAQVGILRTHPEVSMVAAPAMNWHSDGAKSIQPMTVPRGVLPPGAWIPKILQQDDNAACPSSVLLRAGILKQVGGFETSFKGPLMLFEDQVTWFKITLASPVYFQPEPLTLYRIHAESCCVSTPLNLERAGRIVLYARLAEFIRTSTGPASKRGLLLAMARTRIGELLLRTERQHRESAKALDTSGAVHRQGVGAVLSIVLLLSTVSKGKAITLFRKIFDLLSVAYYDGALQSATAVPALLMSVSRSIVPRTLRKRPVRGDGGRSSVLFNLRARMRLAFGIEPLSYQWGFDRGVPIHRFYTEQFLSECARDIRGHCLEFQEDRYTSRFGGRRHSKLDILHRDDSNRKATLIADLTAHNEIPNNTFDCIICTFVLHVIFDVSAAVNELYRILKPGGVLIVAVPKVSMDGPEYSELWRFTSAGLKVLLSRSF